MPLPWLQVIDAVIGVTNFARSRRSSRKSDESESRQLATVPESPGGLETRLASVVVAALKEAFDRDSRRVDFEREQMEAERRRAEQALRLELARQAGDREIGRLRFIAAIAVAAWIGSLLFVGRLASAAPGARFSFAVGWMLLIASLAASFNGQSRIGRDLERMGAASDPARPDAPGPRGGDMALWLLVAALAVVAFVAVVA